MPLKMARLEPAHDTPKPNGKVTEKPHGKGGRPTAFRSEFIQRIPELAIGGCTDSQVAALCGVTKRTVNNWKHSVPGFFQSLKEAKLKLDLKVCFTIYEAACRGNVTAAIFWLKNRMPEVFREKAQHEVNANALSLEQALQPWEDLSEEQRQEQEEILRKGKDLIDKALKESGEFRQAVTGSWL